MVICFDATTEAKKALDLLLGSRQFRDVSEVISMALMNYEVLQRRVASGGTVTPTPSEVAFPPVKTASPATPPTINTSSSRAPVGAPTSKAIPELFAIQNPITDGIRTVSLEESTTPPIMNLPPKDWLFGQFNRFLPAKATCRALLNISTHAHAGITVNEAASKISLAACDLGDYLRELDIDRSLKREDSFAAAFPSTTYHGAESRIRFGGQFVGNVKQGQLTGLPGGLKLITCDSSKEPKLMLTNAGLKFAAMENPVLDSVERVHIRKLSEAETEFILEHITKFVGPELSAYIAVIDGIKSGATTPEKLDTFLCSRFGLTVVEKAEQPNQITQTFLTTQRTGAISRMADLDLIGRDKKGIRVTYFATQHGERFRNSIQNL